MTRRAHHQHAFCRSLLTRNVRFLGNGETKTDGALPFFQVNPSEKSIQIGTELKHQYMYCPHSIPPKKPQALLNILNTRFKRDTRKISLTELPLQKENRSTSKPTPSGFLI